MDDKAIVHECIRELLQRKGDTRGFSDTDDLFSSGRLASIDALEVVLMLENKYGLNFGDGFDRDQIDSVSGILGLIYAKRPA